MPEWPKHPDGRMKIPREMTEEERRTAVAIVEERANDPLMIQKFHHMMEGGQIH